MSNENKPKHGTWPSFFDHIGNMLEHLQEKSVKPEKQMFTDDQLDHVIGILKSDPKSVVDLLASAEGGNQDDLQFLAEASIRRGVSFWVNDTGLTGKAIDVDIDK